MTAEISAWMRARSAWSSGEPAVGRPRAMASPPHGGAVGELRDLVVCGVKSTAKMEACLVELGAEQDAEQGAAQSGDQLAEMLEAPGVF